MLIKLILVDSNHFIRYKSKITHCLDFQTLSEYILATVLDDDEKLFINEVPEVLIGVETFTSTSSFNELHYVPLLSTCLRALHVYVPYVSMCLELLHACVPSFFLNLCAYVVINIFSAYMPLCVDFPHGYVPKTTHFYPL